MYCKYRYKNEEILEKFAKFDNNVKERELEV